MGNYLVQGGTTLYRMTPGGALTTLSPGVSLFGASTPCRAAILSDYVVIVNGLTYDVYLDAFDVIRPLRLEPPATPPVVAEGTLTGSSWTDGVYQAAVSYKIKDAYGRTIQESALGPAGTSAAFTVATSMALTSVAVSPSSNVNARGIYITAAAGSVFYPWLDIDDNTRTGIEEHYTLTKTGTSALPTVQIGSTPPNFKLVCAWKDRVWGVPRVDVDALRWCEERVFYNWPEENEIIIPLKGTDTTGVNAFIPRRDALGLGRLGALHRITGDSNDTFQRDKIADVGVWSQASVVVVQDTAYFLGFSAGRFGFYEWSDAGVTPISDAQVDNWLNSTTYFAKAYFNVCEGRYNIDTDAVEFALTAVDSTVLDRWVSYHVKTRSWYGPHTTAAFTLSAAGTTNTREGVLTTSAGAQISVFGGTDGYLYKRDSSTANDHDSAVDFNCDLPFLSAGVPDYEKVWGQPTVHSRVETADDTLLITPRVGGLNAVAKISLSHTLTKGRERLSRLGQGRYVQLNLRHNVAAKGVRIHGLELPYTVRGRR